jgi:adenine-specific DNA-methyltransferase
MVQYSCEKCGKTFKQKGHYTKHLQRKTPCDNIVNKIEKIVEDKVEEKLQQLLEKGNIVEKIVEGNVNLIHEKDIETKHLILDDNEIDNLNIDNEYDDIKLYYDNILNKDKKSFKTKNDEPTPISCIEEMIDKLPIDIWNKGKIKILDPCSGNGNFFIPIYKKLKEKYNNQEVLDMLYFNDTNTQRINNIKKVFNSSKYNLNITNEDFLEYDENMLFDLIVANPPYAKLLKNGKRASKNHNLIKDFIYKSLKILNEGGYILYLTPDNWMSMADRNNLIKELTKYQIIHLNIHTAKDYFPKIGSSFTWYIIQKKLFYKDITVEGRWKGTNYTSTVSSRIRSFIPQYYNKEIDSISIKTLENKLIKKFGIETTSDLHKYTKKNLISIENDDEHPYRLIHTPKQTVYSSKPHKWQYGYKLFISTTDKYSTFVDNCGMTQSIAFIRCESKNQAEIYKNILDHDLYKFLNNICRWGNFNNIRILQLFPIPDDTKNIWNNFNLTDDEIQFIKENV